MENDTHVFYSPARENSGEMILKTPEGIALKAHYLGQAHQNEDGKMMPGVNKDSMPSDVDSLVYLGIHNDVKEGLILDCVKPKI